MTTIAFDGRYLAADKGSWSGGVVHVVTKIHCFTDEDGHANFIAFAGAHSFVDQALRYISGKLDDVPEYPYKDAENIVGAVLVCPKKNLICSLDEKLRKSYFDYYAPFSTGMGSEFAMGVMSVGHGAEVAVENAIQWTGAAAHGIDVVDLITETMETRSIKSVEYTEYKRG